MSSHERGVVCTGSHGEAVFTGVCWVTAKLFRHMEQSALSEERLHQGFCTGCHRRWGHTSHTSRCVFCGWNVLLNGVKGECPANPAEGQRVTAPFGEAVFSGYCWLQASLYDYLRDNPPNFDDDDDGFEPLCVSELGGCHGCGAYWGNSYKGVTCAFCGSLVSLT